MKDEKFVDKVKQYFSFLEKSYGYKMIIANNSALRPDTDGIVKYTSNSTQILIDSEMGQASVRFTRIHDDEKFYLDPVSIHEYLNTSQEEKQILLSKDVKDKEIANKIFNKTYLLTP